MATVQLSPPPAPFQKIKNPGESISINTAGKVLVLPTGNSTILPSFNEYALNSNRLTIAESPFGGLKGSGSPDYAVGTIYTATDGVYITDKDGSNSSKTLTAGKLKEVSSLTVDTTAKTIEEEFILANTGTSNTPTTIEDGTNSSDWAVTVGTTPTLASDGSEIHFSATAPAAGAILIRKTTGLDSFKTADFAKISMKISETSAGNRLWFRIYDTSGYSLVWVSVRFVVGTSNTIFILPLKAPALSAGQNPSTRTAGFNINNISYIEIGLMVATGLVGDCYIQNISTDVAKSAYAEIRVPDNLNADSSVQIQAHNGTGYQTIGNYKLDSVYSAVGTPTSANWLFNDGTKLDDAYPATPYGRALFPKSYSSQTVNGSTGTMTYSTIKGTKNRIGIRADLPPSDSGRTNFNKIKLKFIFTYANSGATSYEFLDSTNASYGLQNLVKPWIALYDPAGNYIDFYLFTHRPKNLVRKRDDSGNIYEMTLYPGNGSIYRGRIINPLFTTDSNSDLVPDAINDGSENFMTSENQTFLASDSAFFDAVTQADGSLSKFLAAYGMMI